MRVHVKIVNQPTATFDPISTQLNNAATGFAQAEIGVDVITVERIQVTDMDTLDVGACRDFQPTTAQQNTLYGHRNNVQPGEIVIYIVKAIKQDGVDGCATQPAGRPGAIVEYSSHLWARPRNRPCPRSGTPGLRASRATVLRATGQPPDLPPLQPAVKAGPGNQLDREGDLVRFASHQLR
ncbi:hypothetical protein [Streptodolium elevatio]